MGEMEAIVDAVTGGLVGRAVEPAAGEGDSHAREANCLNCGAALVGPYCFACGQHAHVHRTLSAFFHDFAHGVLHFEGKIWRTLPMLAWKPGELTRRYIDGQRARFVSPIALFLFSVFLSFFLVAGINFAVGTFAVRLKSILGLLRAKYFLLELFSGLLIPISFFPHIFQTMFAYMPFEYISYIPVLIYLGKISGFGILKALGMQIFWVAALVAIGHALWSLSSRQITIQGG